MCGVPYREPDFSDEDEEEEEIASRQCIRRKLLVYVFL